MKRILVYGGLVGLLMPALPVMAEMYKWTDAEGRVHFSDKKPTTNRPVQVMEKPVPVSVGGAAAPAAAAPVVSESAAERTERQRRAADALKEDREAAEAAAAKARAEKEEREKRCHGLRDYARNAQCRRLYTLDAKGERVYMSDAEHAAHLRQLQQNMDEACR